MKDMHGKTMHIGGMVHFNPETMEGRAWGREYRIKLGPYIVGFSSDGYVCLAKTRGGEEFMQMHRSNLMIGQTWTKPDEHGV